MSRFRSAFSIAAAAIVFIACSEAGAPLVAPDHPVFARPDGNGSTTTTPPVAIAWEDSPAGAPAGIRSDGAGAYITDTCGVFTDFYIGKRSSQLTADFDYGYDGSCGPRHLVFDFTLDGGPAPAFGSPLVSAPKFAVRDIDAMVVGESRLQWMGFGVQQEGCGRVLFHAQYAGSTDARITRLADAEDGARQWRVETQGAATAVCVVAAKGNGFDVISGPYHLPFAFTITEAR